MKKKSIGMVSVIISIYNAEKFLDRCLESLRSQTYSDFEVICVNDGSEDDSENIIRKFQTVDDRFHLISQMNQGASAARNAGIEAARGEYIAFADSDDYAEPDFLQKLVDAMTDDVGMVCSAYYDEDDDGVTEKRALFSHDVIMQKVDALNYAVSANEFGGYSWNKLFRQDIIDNNHIRYDSHLTICEDQSFVCHYIDCIKCVHYISDGLYHYSYNENSVIRSGFSIEKLLEILNAYRLIMKFASEKYPDSEFYIVLSRTV